MYKLSITSVSLCQSRLCATQFKHASVLQVCQCGEHLAYESPKEGMGALSSASAFSLKECPCMVILTCIHPVELTATHYRAANY